MPDVRVLGNLGNPSQVIENEWPRKTIGISQRGRRENEQGTKPGTLHRQPL